jgi:hypothetical protein
MFAVTLAGCGAGFDAQVRRAATAFIAPQDIACDEWQVYQVTPADIRPQAGRLLDAGLGRANQLQLAEQGSLYAASCPSFACEPLAYVTCTDGPESCIGLIDNFLPITCTPLTY